MFCSVQGKMMLRKHSFIIEPTQQATASFLLSMQGSPITGGQAVAQANFEAQHNRLKPFWDVDYRELC